MTKTAYSSCPYVGSSNQRSFLLGGVRGEGWGVEDSGYMYIRDGEVQGPVFFFFLGGGGGLKLVIWDFSR